MNMTCRSAARVEDTLQAEYPNLQMYFEIFRGGKAEQNRDSLAELIGGNAPQLQAVLDMLVRCGFLERVGESWKVPMLYRDGLDITQGKAFAPDEPVGKRKRFDRERRTLQRVWGRSKATTPGQARPSGRDAALLPSRLAPPARDPFSTNSPVTVRRLERVASWDSPSPRPFPG